MFKNKQTETQQRILSQFPYSCSQKKGKIETNQGWKCKKVEKSSFSSCSPAKRLHRRAANAHELQIFVGAVGEAFVGSSHRFQNDALLFVAHLVGNDDVVVQMNQHLTRTAGKPKGEYEIRNALQQRKRRQTKLLE